MLEESSDTIFSEIKLLDSVKSYNVVSNVESVKYNIIYDFEKISSSYLSKAQIDQVIAMNINGLDLNQFTFNNELININIVSDIMVMFVF